MSYYKLIFILKLDTLSLYSVNKLTYKSFEGKKEKIVAFPS